MLPSNSTSGADEDSSSENLENFVIEGKVVLILCGLVASGKSTFAESLQIHYPQIRRCNQDDLGDRRRVEQLARESLSQGLSVCIDRTNFNASQRFHWIKIARSFPGTAIWVIVFDTPYETCAARLQERTGHPTITSPEQGLSVLSRFAADFEAPEEHEGYDRILYVKPSDHLSPRYTRADISAILQRVRNSAPVTAATSRTFPALEHSSTRQSSFRGNLLRGQHGWPAPNFIYSHNSPNPGSRLSNGSRGWQTNPSRGNSSRGRSNQGNNGRGSWGGHYTRTEGNQGQSNVASSEFGDTANDPYTID